MKDLNGTLETLFTKMEDFISTKTVVGEPIHAGDITILPLIDVTFGFGAGGGGSKGKKDSEKSENTNNGNNGAGGGGGGGAKIEPSAVIVVNQKTSHVQLVNVKNQDSLNKIIDMAPGILAKIQESLSKRKQKNEDEPEEDDDEEGTQA